MKKYLGIDVGGSSIKYGIIDESLVLQNRGSIETPKDTMEHFVETIGKIYDDCKEIISGIAMSLPGVIDPDKGYSYSGGALPYIKNMETVKILQERCPVPITIGNDAKCAGLAEVGFGSLQDVDDGAVIVLGTGIGGCLIKDRKVHTGKHFSAGEFSFIKTDIDDYNNMGQLWAYRNGISGLLTRYQINMGTNEKVTGKEIFEAINNGSDKAIKALDEFTLDLAVEIYNIQAVFDPEKFAIGGGISAQPALFESLEKNVKHVVETSGMPIPMPQIVPCAFRNDANIIGAYYQHITQINQ